MKARIYFRPSSHSEDYTIVATFPSVEKALNAMKNAPAGKRRGNKLLVYLSNSYRIDADEVEAQLEEFEPSNVQVYDCYQELVVQFVLPRGISKDTLLLVLNREQLLIMHRLTTQCRTPKITRTNEKEIWTFEYAGERIFFDYHNSQFRIGEHWISLGEYIKVPKRFDYP